MAKEALINFIQNSLPIPQQTLADIVSNFEPLSIKKNDLLLEAGQISDAYFFMEEGFMRAYTFDTEGNDVTTYFYSKNSFVFDVSSFFMRTLSTENIQALTDCTGYTITFEKLNLLFHTIPEFREFGRKMLVKGFASFKKRTLSLINENAEKRYTNLLNENKDVFQHAQLKYIASYLGITDTSLSRIRREYSKK